MTRTSTPSSSRKRSASPVSGDCKKKLGRTLRPILLSAAALCALAPVAASCALETEIQPGASDDDPSRAIPGSGAHDSLQVGAAVLQEALQPPPPRVSGSLRIHPDHVSLVSAPLDGVVRSIAYRLGDQVEHDKVVSTLYSPALAEAQWRLSSAQLEQTRATLDLGEEVLASMFQVGSWLTFQAADFQAKASEDRLEVAKERVRMLGHKPTHEPVLPAALGIVELNAPEGGQVIRIDVHQGQSVRQGDVLVVIGEPRHLRYVGKIPVELATAFRAGNSINLTYPATNSTVTARVRWLSVQLDPSGELLDVHADAFSRDRALRPGMWVEAYPSN